MSRSGNAGNQSTAVVQAVFGVEARTGGPSRSVPALARGLRELGYDVHFVLAAAPSAPSSEAQRAFAEGIGWKTSLPRSQLVHVHGIWAPFTHRINSTAWRRGLPVVISPRGMLEPWALSHHPLRKQLAMWLYQRRDLRRAALLHATSEQEAENLDRLQLGPPIAVIPNGTEMADLEGGRAPKPPDSRRLLFLSRLHPKKGVKELLLAVHTQLAAFEAGGWQLIVAGPDEGGHRTYLEALVDDLGLRQYVQFVGEVLGDEKWKLLRSADLFVLPTHSENFGLVVAEALSAAVPVITTTAAPWAELVSEDCGWCCECGTEALVSTLSVALAASDELRAAMGRRGRQLVIERYSWQRACAMFDQTYSWLLHHAPQPDWIR